jgi:hypothetical protein
VGVVRERRGFGDLFARGRSGGSGVAAFLFGMVGEALEDGGEPLVRLLWRWKGLYCGFPAG